MRNALVWFAWLLLLIALGLSGAKADDKPVTAWMLTVRACAGGTCRTMHRAYGVKYVCDRRQGDIADLLPRIGRTRITARCEAVRGDARA